MIKFFKRPAVARTCRADFKIIMLLMIIILKLQVNAHAQGQVKVTISFNGEPLNTAINKLRENSKVAFAFNGKILESLKAPQLKFVEAPLSTVLDKLLKDSGFQYKFVNGQVVIMPSEGVPSPNVQAGGGPGTLKGRIVEFETSQPLPGATVYLAELQRGMQSNMDGYYTFTNVPAGKYTLQVSFIGYSTQKIPVEVKAAKEEIYDVKLQGNNSLKEVVVKGTGKTRAPVAHTSEKKLVEELKAAQSVVSGISSEQISKSADRNVAEAIRKISGVTIKDDKFIIIRGMNERYNLTYLNGNVAPSTELYSRAFSLDLLPTRIIDQILVYKSPAPDLLGDMTGGAVKIFTKDAKNVKHFDIELQTGFRENTTFNKNFLTYQGSGTDFLGFDGGTRKLPSAVPGFGNFNKANISQATYATAFSTILNYEKTTATPPVQLTANYYNSFPVLGKNISTLTSLSYKNEPLHTDVDRLQGVSNVSIDPNAPVKYQAQQVGTESQNTQTAQFSLLQNFMLRLRDSSSIYFKNFILQQGQTSTILRNTRTQEVHKDGDWQDVAPQTEIPKRDIILSYQQRTLYSGNLGGDQYFGNNGQQKLDWNGGYTYSRLDIPDQRAIHLQNNIQNQAGLTPVGDFEQNWVAVFRDQNGGTNNLNQGMISRTWTQNTEATYNGSIDYTYKLEPWITIKAGTYQLWKEREVYRRVYTVNEGDLPASGQADPYNPLIGAVTPVDYTMTLFHQQDLNKLWSSQYLRDDGTALKVFDRTSGADAYIATEQNNSGYVAASLLPFNGKLDIYGGLRVEYDRQKVAGAVTGSVNSPVLADLQATKYLPSINIGYRPDSSFVVRAAFGRTLNRPEFVELSPYNNLDYANNQTVTGNPSLVSSTIENYDLRFEFYPKKNTKGETVSLGFFEKQIDHPIERVIFNTYSQYYTTIPTAISFQNANKATVRGLELDVRKSLDFLPGTIFRNLSLIANGSWIYSKVDSVKGPTSNVSTISRQLQGQSPYSANVGVYYENAGTGTKIALIGNQVGPSIYAASAAGKGVAGEVQYQPSLLQLTRRQLDFSFTQRIIKSLQGKISIQNVLNNAVQFAEDANFTYKYEKAQYQPDGNNPDNSKGDPLSSNYKPGRFFLMTFTYGF